MIYRVIVTVGYRKAFFDFSAGINALNFASDVVFHRVPNAADGETEENFEVSINIIKEVEEDGEQED